MITDFTAQVTFHQQDRELADSVERRRAIAERAVRNHGGDRMALIAHLARSARATRAVAAGPAVC